MATPTTDTNEITVDDIRLDVDGVAKNIESWQMNMENYLRSRGLWGIVDGSEPPILDTGDNRSEVLAWVRKDTEALDTIKAAFFPNVPALVRISYSAAEAWTDLKLLTPGRGNADAPPPPEADIKNDLIVSIKKDRNSIDDLKGFEPLHRYNYERWMFKMENYLRHQDLWCVVDPTVLYRTEDSEGIKNSIALRALKQACGTESLEMMGYSVEAWRREISNSQSAEDAWKILTIVGKQAVQGRLGDVAKFLKRVQGYTMSSDAGENLEDTATAILTQSNYRTWKNDMEAFLKSKGLWYCVKPLGDKYYTSSRDAEACETIKKYCGVEMLPHIMYTDCPREAWILLEQADAASREEKESYNGNLRAAKLSRFTYMDDVIHAIEGLVGYEYIRPKCEEYLRILFLWDIVGGVTNEIIRTCCPMEKKHLIYTSNFAEQAWYKLLEPEDPEGLDLDRYTLEKGPCRRLGPIEDLMRKDEPICGFARAFLDAFPEIMSDRLSFSGMTLLHYVITSRKLKFGKDLLDMMTPKQLEIKTYGGNAAISLAVEANYIEMVKLMVCKNSELLLIRNGRRHIPLITSAINGDEEMLRYLYSVTPKLSEKLSDKDGATLITAAIRVEIYDIALDILKEFPGLVATQDDDEMTVINVLAGKPSSFPSGNQFGFLGRCIYWLAGVGTYGLVGEVLKRVPYLKKFHEKKVKHNQVAEIVEFISTELVDVNQETLTEGGAAHAVSLTVIHGIVELFTALIKSNDNLMHQRDKNGDGLFQLAVLHRQENIFKAIIDMGLQHPTTSPPGEKDKNNILHCAGFWRPLLHLHKVSGAALQMQREIQWFKEVQKVVKPKYRDMENEMENGDGLKPEALFTKEHENLVKEGEKWVKEASQACMVVSTLIATVMFASAFTLPGGNDQNTGLPMFLKSRAFLFFILSDAVSLFASCTSVLMFFTLLTTRYAERDFLTSLPTKLILGYLFLFISIATMLATFAATVIIVLRENYSWVYIPVIALASIPVVLFSSLQLPLFVEIVQSTYGRGIFHRKHSGFYYNTMKRLSTWCVNNKLYTFFFKKKTRTKTVKSRDLQV
ncbi:hypothetical protein MKW92_052335 [Papaver armeniacum]|nr:hypothetical protein MKW92_052335 [Papaver armeniacum]